MPTILFSPHFTRVCQAPPIHFLNVTFPQKLSLKIALLKKLLCCLKTLKIGFFLYSLRSQTIELVTYLIHKIKFSGIAGVSFILFGFRYISSRWFVL